MVAFIFCLAFVCLLPHPTLEKK
uniref:Uncharacterized protein n=1 Tax=Rhizophora mucronata TaxID=61149 RepID=A0A2P2R4J6_RHIMU